MKRGSSIAIQLVTDSLRSEKFVLVLEVTRLRKKVLCNQPDDPVVFLFYVKLGQ